VNESRKRVILIAAAILAARKLASCDPDRRVPASITAISDSVKWAALLMREIDERWPERKG
jgi:cation transporter-like permease